jgi:hypothetical protein
MIRVQIKNKTSQEITHGAQFQSQEEVKVARQAAREQVK